MDRTEQMRATLTSLGLANPIIMEFSESTATAVDAANAIGTTVGRIVKSLVFMAGDTPILVLASGPNRVDTARLQAMLGQPIRRADADTVRTATGYAIGGVPPFGHATQLVTYVDRDLLQYDEVWAAAGTPRSVFAIEPQRLVELTRGEVAQIAQT
jgi:prolyl-tRNA editing enzyme YbaK/EbsC (Cys-tRNA(Pro) deacylase)